MNTLQVDTSGPHWPTSSWTQGHCPRCDSTNTTYKRSRWNPTGPRFDWDFVDRNGACNDCGIKWLENYKIPAVTADLIYRIERA